MAEDIVPELLDAIQKDFARSIKDNPALDRVAELVKSGAATYKDANDYATWTGQLLSVSIKRNITAGTLPDGKMYFNIADRILGDTMNNNYEMISKVTTQIQDSLNKQANIGMKAIKPKVNQGRIDGLINRVAGEDHFETAAWLLDEPIVNFSESIVDDTIRANVEFQAAAGLAPVIHRIPSPGCCEWCNEIAGIYKYPDVPEDVYRRHERCRCRVEYDPRDGKRQNVWNKNWRDRREEKLIEQRKNFVAPSMSPKETLERGFKKVSLDKMDGDMVMGLANGNKVFDETFPQMAGYVDEIKASAKPLKSKMGQFTPTLDGPNNIQISKISVAELESNYDRMAKKNYMFNTGKPAEQLLVHEKAHALEWKIASSELNGDELRRFWNSGKISKEITNDALRNLGVDPKKNPRQAYEAMKGLGDYALSDKKELFAEAVSNALTSDDPLPFSLEVVKEAKKRLK